MNTKKNFERLILFLLVAVGIVATVQSCSAQPAQRIKLTQLEQSKTVEGTKAGQIGLTNAAGDQRYAQYVEIQTTPIVYVPTPTGNLSNISEFVEDSLSRIWYIDWQGNAVLLNDPETCDQDWLRISDNGCPEALTDSLYKYKYASIGARYVWPGAEFLVSDSASVGKQVISGDRNARLALHDNSNGTESILDQGGSQTTQYIESTAEGGVYQIATSTGTNGDPFIQTRHFTVNAADSTIQFNQYPNTRNDTGTPVNVLTTATNGKVQSHPASEVVTAGGGVTGTIAAGQVAYGASANVITGSSTNTYAPAASGNNATGSYIGPTLTATANNQFYTALQVEGTFAPGAFTGTSPFIATFVGSTASPAWKPYIAISEGRSVVPPTIRWYRNSNNSLSTGTLRMTFAGNAVASTSSVFSDVNDAEGFQFATGTSQTLILAGLTGTGDFVPKSTSITKTTHRFRGNVYSEEIIVGSDEDANSDPIGGIIRSGSKNNIAVSSNIAATNLTIQAGRGTGNSTSNGDIIFQTPDATASGTALQSYTTKATIKRSGFVGIGTTGPTQELEVSGDIAANHLQGRGSAPTVTVNTTTCGAGATATVSGYDLGFVVTVTFGTSPSAGGGDLFRINYNTTLPGVGIPIMFPGDDGGLASELERIAGAYVANPDNTDFELWSNGDLSSFDSDVLRFNFHVIAR